MFMQLFRRAGGHIKTEGRLSLPTDLKSGESVLSIMESRPTSTGRLILVLLCRAELLFSCSFAGGRKMAFRTLCVVLLLSSLPNAGCGTVANLVKPGPAMGGKTPFGG